MVFNAEFVSRRSSPSLDEPPSASRPMHQRYKVQALGPCLHVCNQHACAFPKCMFMGDERLPTLPNWTRRGPSARHGIEHGMDHWAVLISREPAVVHHGVVEPLAALGHELELEGKALQFMGCESVEVAASLAELVKFGGQHMVRQHIPHHPAPFATKRPDQGTRRSAGFVSVAVLIQRTVKPDAHGHLLAPPRFDVSALHGVAHKVAQLALGVQPGPMPHRHVRQIVHSCNAREEAVACGSCVKKNL